MSIAEFVLGLAVLGLSVYYFIFKNRTKNAPPGPWGIPILGHLPLLGSEPHKTAFKWSKTGKYPSIVSVRFGSIPAVIISDVKLIKEALNEPSFAGRPNMRFLNDRSGGKVKGIIFTERQQWAEQRRFSLRQLRELGFGKKSMESIVQDEIQELVETLRGKVGQGFTTRRIFNAAVVNALWTIIAGERFEQDDPQLKKILDMLITSFENNNVTAAISMFIPWICTIASELSGYNRLIKDSNELADFLNKPIIQHEKTLEENSCRDFIDVYLKESKKTTDRKSTFHPSHSELTYVLMDLFIAGAETLSTTLSWSFLYLAKFPQIQEKLQSEIDKVVGKSRLPSLTDRTEMPYTQAVMSEILRYSSIAPLAFFHSALHDVQFAGYTIAKGTMIMPNLYAAHFSESVWGDPEEFRPERFLDESGNFKKHEGVLAFSFGKRACLGETLARDELFLFMVSLFQRFQVSPDPKMPGLDLNPKVGSVLMPKPHTLILKERV